MMPACEMQMSEQDLEAVAWNFLSSEFTGPIYADWPIDRRVEVYLVHNGLMRLVNHGGAYAGLLERIMNNIGPALRRGILAPPTR